MKYKVVIDLISSEMLKICVGLFTNQSIFYKDSKIQSCWIEINLILFTLQMISFCISFKIGFTLIS